jgi:hypothetical protein
MAEKRMDLPKDFVVGTVLQDHRLARGIRVPGIRVLFRHDVAGDFGSPEQQHRLEAVMAGAARPPRSRADFLA